jgi:exosortase D (VPLPA-CTERM-specific)
MNVSDAIRMLRAYVVPLSALLILCYYKVIPAMIGQWSSDDNYSHGFIVPFIAGYFIYSQRTELARIRVAPWPPGLVVVGAGLGQLIVGSLASEYFTMRSSLVVVLAGFVLLFFGRELFRKLLLPMGYLFLMVPLPYIIYDSIAFPLKLFVTTVSVAALKLMGIAVLREGNIILFPNIVLEVAEACSGIRSLVSLLALGIAYAVILPLSPFRRWLLICSIVPIAIITNAMRVIMTGVLAHFWGERAAEGFFHEFAGLAVFTLALFMLIVVGRLIKISKHEDQELARPVSTGSVLTSYVLPGRSILACIIMLGITGLYLYVHSDLSIPLNRPLSQFPAQVNGWRTTSQSEFSGRVSSLLKPTDYLQRSYVDRTGNMIELYVGYHDGGPDSGDIHSPRQCLPGSGWHKVASKDHQIETSAGRLNLVEAIYQKGDTQELFLYWYQVKNSSITSEYRLKLARVINSLKEGRRDASFVRVTVPMQVGAGDADAIGLAFLREFYPLIAQYLPH